MSRCPRHRWLYPPLLALTLHPSVCAAQSNPTALLRLPPGQHVLVETSGGARLEGDLRYARVDSLALEHAPSDIVLPVSEIERVHSRGRATGTGALIGGAIGLIGGIVFGAYVANDVRDEEQMTYISYGAVMGFGAGVLLGGLIGTAVPRWHEKYDVNEAR
jgi:hypothetical protein